MLIPPHDISDIYEKKILIFFSILIFGHALE